MGIPVYLPEIRIHATIQSNQLGESLGWPLEKYNVPSAWAVSRGEGVTVGVLDSGVDPTHLEKGDLQKAVIHAQDFTKSPNGWASGNPHGSHVAGIIGARQGNNIGISSVAPDCKMCVAKVLDNSGNGDSVWVAAGIRWLVDQGCQIINFSGGSPVPSDDIAKAIEYATQHKCLFVAAAGNSGLTENTAVGFPANMESVIAVTATTEDGTLADFSSWGPQVDTACPGTHILSCGNGGNYILMSGTSQAAPYFTGCVALAMSAGVKFDGTARQAREWIKTVSMDAGTPGEDQKFGIGMVDFSKFIPATPKPEPPKIPTEHGEHIIDFGPIFKKALGLDIPIKGVAHYPAKEGDLISLSLKVD